MNSIFTTVMVLVILMALYSIISFLRKLKRLRREKQQGVLDFIDEEYIDYLSSSKSELTVINNIVFVCKEGYNNGKFRGDLLYNNAGVFINPQLSNNSYFIFGIERPSKFSPRQELFCIGIERFESTIILRLSSQNKRKITDIKIEILEVSETVFEDLQAIIEPVLVGK